MISNLALSVFAAVTSLGGVVVSSASSDSKVLDDLRTCSTFSVSDYPQVPSLEKNQGVGGDFSCITLLDGQDSFSSLYLYFYHPSGSPLLYWDPDAKLYSAAGGFQVKLAPFGDYDSPRWYDCSSVTWSDDRLFVKAKVSVDFGFDSSSALRGYMVDSFAILDYDRKRSFSYALGDCFEFSSSGLKHSVYNVLPLSPIYYVCAIPGVNSHSGDSFGGSTFSEAHDCYSEVFSAVFPVPDYYGDCVGVRLSWTSTQWYRDFSVTPSGDTLLTEGASVVNASSVSPGRNVVDFSRDDTQKVLGWSSSRASSAGFMYKLFTDWGRSGSDDWDIPLFSKVKPLLNGKLYWELEAQKLSDNPCLFPTDDVAKSALALFAPLTSVYCLHFDIRDWQTTSSVSWGTVIGGVLSAGVSLIVQAFNGSITQGRSYFWDMTNVSVLNLLMKRNGATYVLHVSDDQGSVSGNDATNFFKKNGGFDWEKFFRVCLVCGGIFAGVYVTYRIVRGARGKARHGRR